MIKFRCPHCDQKLGVPEAYAGRRVRCTRCQEVTEAPSPSAAALDKSAAALDVQPQKDEATEDGLQLRAEEPAPEVWVDPGLLLDETEAARMEAIARARPPQRAPARGTAKPRSAASRPDDTYDPDERPGMKRMAIAVACSVAATLIAAAIWAPMMAYLSMVGCWSGPLMLLLEVGIAIAGALVLGGAMQRTGIRLGLLAAVIGIGGILVGKCFVAKWYWVPRALYELDSKGSDRAMGFFARFTMVENEEALHMIATAQLAAKSEIDPACAEEIGMAYAAFLKYQVPLPAFDGEHAAAHEKVKQAVAGWSDKNKEVAAGTSWAPTFRTYLRKFVATEQGAALLFKDVLTSVFSPLDVLFIPFGAILAFRICWKDSVGTGGF
ncbi:MAG: hypothetical protein IH624_14905 [Phycisphaerae bacterium]|nr:hypothetical protein [Phycisphaerae bacterium]